MGPVDQSQSVSSTRKFIHSTMTENCQLVATGGTSTYVLLATEPSCWPLSHRLLIFFSSTIVTQQAFPLLWYYSSRWSIKIFLRFFSSIVTVSPLCYIHKRLDALAHIFDRDFIGVLTTFMDTSLMTLLVVWPFISITSLKNTLIRTRAISLRILELTDVRDGGV